MDDNQWLTQRNDNIGASELYELSKFWESIPPDGHLTRDVATLLNKSIDCPVDVFVIIIEYTGDTYYIGKSPDGTDVIFRRPLTLLFIERKRTIVKRLSTTKLLNKHYSSLRLQYFLICNY